MARSHTVTITKKSFSSRPAVTFEAKVGGRIVRGIVAKVGDKYFAYQNLCKHVPVTLDCADGEVTTIDGTQIQCQMHGAIYEMATGECTIGPCVGSRLNRFELFEERDRLVIVLPESPEMT